MAVSASWAWLNRGMSPTENVLSDPLFIAQPPGAAQQLFLLFHGVGGQPRDLQALGQRLAQAFPQAAIVALPGAQDCDLGRGRQWFSVRGIDDANRAPRVDAALPAFVAAVQHWQQRLQVPPAATALVGFSQGGILALEAAKQPALLAARVIAIGARYARLPQAMNAHCTVHLVHGKDDPVMPYGLAVSAAEHLVSVGADVTADVLPQVRHEITEEVIDVVLGRLQRYIPQARWREALAAEAATRQA